MEAVSERRDHPRVQLFPAWDERDIHRVWLFHKEEPGTLFGLLVDLSISGGQLIMREPDKLPQAFRLSVLDQQGKAVETFTLQVTQLWHQPFLPGLEKVGFECQPICDKMVDKLVSLAKLLSSNQTEFLLTRIESV